MNSNFFSLPLTLAAATLILGCASKPTSIPNISASANPPLEIDKTEQMLTDARNRQVDVLSPTNFREAEKAFSKAQKLQEKNKASEDILKQVSYSRGFLEQANAKAELATTAMKDIARARADAIAAGATQQYPNEFSKIGRDLEHVTKSIEEGNLEPADKHGNNLTAEYHDLEIKSVRKANLGVADQNIEAALKEKADKKTPKSLALAIMKYDNADKIIRANPKNHEAIRSASADATRESIHLTQVLKKVNAGNTEDLVLQSERQGRTITNLREEYSSAEEELHSSQQLLTEKERQLAIQTQVRVAADRIRQQLKPTEAEVYTESGKVMIRLKGLQFATNKAILEPKNQALLNKVGEALRDIETSKVIVEGHTDATGNTDHNVILSEERATVVEEFLVSNGTFENDKVEAVGVGPDKPISDNATARGRAENRRIDLVIEM